MGVLSRHSETFRGLFNTSRPADVDAELKVDGCPVIPVQDSAHDFKHLLHVLYDGLDTYLEPGKPIEFGILAALVRLSYNYQLDRIFAITLGLMKVVFTDDFQAWRARENKTEGTTRVKIKDKNAIEAFNLLRTCGQPELLPVALYICCGLETRVLLRGVERADGSLEKLRDSDLERCLAARDVLELQNAALNRSVFDFADPARQACLAPSTCPVTLHNIGHMAGLGTKSETEARRVFHRILAETPMSVVVCSSCASFVTSGLTMFYENLWRDLPRILDLPVPTWLPAA
ncbi:hypothetical protein TRAPUB_9054 [Trametes pubescens]|uniref:BTB domain-containing protein n=1 Tax=Trametes pubescens TaxID=154538 RepID=A0A1M2W3N7_TRAPU|nr:hypothetical protein TRAPUB_9054 [Trametes pubescens]